jgi:SAM-dependent methyltransferase
MNLIPWRVRHFAAERFPLAYHLIANAGTSRNSSKYWDKSLEKTWNAANRQWPRKVQLITESLAPDDSVVDLGCGTGSLLRDLKERGFAHLSGVEQSQYAVNRLVGEGFAMVRGSVLNTGLPSRHFQGVIASEVLEHIIFRSRFLREIRRILAPGGRAMIFVPNDFLGPMDEPEHVIKYNSTSLKRFLGKFLEVEKIVAFDEPSNGMKNLLAVCRKNY